MHSVVRRPTLVPRAKVNSSDYSFQIERFSTQDLSMKLTFFTYRKHSIDHLPCGDRWKIGFAIKLRFAT